MFNSAVPTKGVPRYLSSDNDPLFEYHRWQANLRILEIKEIKSVPYTPISHPFIERLIGTIRREYLDQTLFWNVVDLERKLSDFQSYYNHHRTHSSLGGDTPDKDAGVASKLPINLDNFRWQTYCRGLYQLPIAA
jgi:transposase InsO family protein